MISKLEHIGVFVKDMDESIEFYQKVLGMRLAARKKTLDNGVELGFFVVSRKRKCGDRADRPGRGGAAG